MRKTLTMATAVIGSFVIWHPNPASADEHSTLPAVIVCSIADKQNFAYLTTIEADGTARYMTMTGSFAEVSPDQVVMRTQNQAAGDCAGKTIDELRSAGQTREFAK